MRTGRLSISRGHQRQGVATAAAPHLSLVSAEASSSAPAEPSPRADLGPVNERLTALERLIRLAEQGALSAEEFAEQKALILNRPVEQAMPVDLAHRPSLVGRIGWKLLPAGLAAGLALSWLAQPDQTARFFDETLRLFGF